ncbi:type IV pili twitching motility protein PilT [Vulcanibacillus modesticaldus]|uniref:Type IV pili twitching motility protein PilT n=1 Tax=Vulcanibacillus modesticaldus TaxID=337097 RepID=A0A1D2YT02_9BACI|nr:type IV pilus twitching motility protein PilT [Vulcanibacillus modesticaldus]OEF98110.1 type IV pili twitching motility protein PilT [Vulcanibacillus modesticaldus]
MQQGIKELMLEAFNRQASDLHITVGAKPTLRIHGRLVPIGERTLTSQDTSSYLKEIVTESQYQEFLDKGELDFSYGIPGVSRFRINAYKQRGTISLAIRVIPTRIPNLDELGAAPILKTFVDKPQGLILVTGPTGSGKSTTLAAMINLINRTQQKHIITLEDPIEYLHRHDKSLVDQREIGVDSDSFATALRSALRQDPDVILVGEMRDLETISTAITAAETGHLVLATLHTTDAANTIDRIIDVFPAYQQPQIRLQLASVLVGIVSQRLIPTFDEKGRVVAMEILVNTPAIANLIRSEKVHQIKTVMQTGKGFGMQTMEAALKELVLMGKISDQSAKRYLLNWNG